MGLAKAVQVSALNFNQGSPAREDMVSYERGELTVLDGRGLACFPEEKGIKSPKSRRKCSGFCLPDARCNHRQFTATIGDQHTDRELTRRPTVIFG